MTNIKVTAANIADIRDQISGVDLKDAVEVGQTIEIIRHHPNIGGHTVIFDDERAGIFMGGDSVWGDVEDDRNVRLDGGELVNLEGEAVE